MQCTHERPQERRASARRGVRYERVAARVEHCSAIGEHKTRSGGRQPAVCSVRRTMSAVCRRSLASAFPNPRLADASRSWSQMQMPLLVCVSYRRARYSSHGWLTPAALDCTTSAPCRMQHLQCTNARAHRSGGRQPAVCSVRRTMSAVCRRSLASAFPNARLAYASRSWSQTRMLLPVCVSYRRARYSSHGWLTPAALGARRTFGQKCAICNAHTNVRKSGGRQPAVGYDTNALLRELSTVRQSANTKLGAAGVSPPCARSVERCLPLVADHLQVRSPTHGWLTPAALGRKCRCRCWCAFRTGERATHPTAGLRQPLLDGASWLYKGDGYCQGVAVRQAAFTFAICWPANT
jgi:hypothetical protein